MRRNVVAFLGSTSTATHRNQYFGAVSSLSSSSVPCLSTSISLLPVACLSKRESSVGRAGQSSSCLLMSSRSGRGGGRGGGGRSGRGGRGGRGGGRGRGGSNNNRRRNRRARSPAPPMPPPGQPGRECYRSCISIGGEVYVVKKEDQRSGRETRGVVSRLLTNSAYHPRGQKVMLVDEVVGRVTRFIIGDEGKAASVEESDKGED